MNMIAMILAATGLGLGVAGEPDKCPLCAENEKTAEVTPEATPVIDPAEYAKAEWPKHNSGDALYAKDFQGKQLPVTLGNETWLSEQVKTEGKVLVLDFWATWCPPCVAASPILDKLQKDHKDDLAILAIGGQREDIDTVRSYMGEHKVAYSHLFDENQSVFTPFDSEGIPLVVVISTDGVVRWIGNPHDKNFKKAVAQTLKVDPMVNAS